MKNPAAIDLMLLSRLQAHFEKLAMADAKFKIEAESIGFVNYKEQYPLYVNRIERLLNIFENKKPEEK